MRTTDLLVHLRECGVQLHVNGYNLKVSAPKGVLTSELRDTLIQSKAEIIAFLKTHNSEIAWRVQAMLPQIPNEGQIPLLVAREAVEPGPDECLSCGDPIHISKFLCQNCERAENLAIELAMSKAEAA